MSRSRLRPAMAVVVGGRSPLLRGGAGLRRSRLRPAMAVVVGGRSPLLRGGAGLRRSCPGVARPSGPAGVVFRGVREGCLEPGQGADVALAGRGFLDAEDLGHLAITQLL